MTGLKLPFWGLSFVEFWCWGLIFGGQGGAGPPGPPLDPPLVVFEPNLNALYEGEQGSFVGGVSTASSSVIGSTYMRGVRYSYEGRVLLTMNQGIFSQLLTYIHRRKVILRIPNVAPN